MEVNLCFSPSGLKVGRIRSFYFFMFNYLVKYTKIKKEDTIMIKVALNIKNGSKVFKPTEGSLILYDGKDWYVTTKEDLFKEYDEHFADKIAECNQKIEEITVLKQELAAQMVEYSEMIKTIVLQGEK